MTSDDLPNVVILRYQRQYSCKMLNILLHSVSPLKDRVEHLHRSGDVYGKGRVGLLFLCIH